MVSSTSSLKSTSPTRSLPRRAAKASTAASAMAADGSTTIFMRSHTRRIARRMEAGEGGLAGNLVILPVLLTLLARGRYVLPGKSFPQWKAPEQLVWVLILSGFIVAFADGPLATVALNLLVILLPVYFLQGLAVIDCFFRRKAFSPVIRTIGYLLLTLVNPLPMLVTGIGVFDLWADFRKPREPES